MTCGNAGAGAKVFAFPRLYKFKVRFINSLNRTKDIGVDALIEGKEVLDLGCGPFVYVYDPERPALKVGLDRSYPFVAYAAHTDPTGFHLVADAVRIPFADHSFDVVLLSYLLHHLPPDTVPAVLREASRVARAYLVITDHLQSPRGLPRTVKSLWWRTDGGYHYNTAEEWRELLAGFRVIRELHTGVLFRNIYKVVCRVRGEP